MMERHESPKHRATHRPNPAGLLVKLTIEHPTLTAGEIEALVRALSPDRHEDRPN